MTAAADQLPWSSDHRQGFVVPKRDSERWRHTPQNPTRRRPRRSRRPLRASWCARNGDDAARCVLRRCSRDDDPAYAGGGEEADAPRGETPPPTAARPDRAGRRISIERERRVGVSKARAGAARTARAAGLELGDVCLEPFEQERAQLRLDEHRQRAAPQRRRAAPERLEPLHGHRAWGWDAPRASHPRSSGSVDRCPRLWWRSVACSVG